jgi:hypothetical protein
MEKILWNSLEEGGVYQLRTSSFKPIENYKDVISDFDRLYESYQESPCLFQIFGDREITIIADTFNLALNFKDIEFDDLINRDSNLDQLRNFLITEAISPLSIEILFSMIENEDFSVSAIIERIAQPNQNFTIQCSDSLYGNNEYEVQT